MIKKTKVVVISGSPGVGKSTICRELLNINKRLRLSVSHTTREKRPGEEDKVHYYFIDREKFEKMIKEDELIEYVEILGNYYGTSKSELMRIQRDGNIPLLDIDFHGAYSLRKLKYPGIYILILPPSIRELRERLKKRKTADEEVERRIKLAVYELKEILGIEVVDEDMDIEKIVQGKNLESVIYDKLIVNRDIMRTVQDINTWVNQFILKLN